MNKASFPKKLRQLLLDSICIGKFYMLLQVGNIKERIFFTLDLEKCFK